MGDYAFDTAKFLKKEGIYDNIFSDNDFWDISFRFVIFVNRKN